MAEDVPEIGLGLTGDAEPVVIVGGGQARDVAGLLRLAPGLATPAHAGALARAVNHLARGNEFRVIEDPAAFAAAYRAKIAAEDPEAEWVEGIVRLRDYGVPDFDAILPPDLQGDRIAFHAADRFLGLPYRVTARLGEMPDYAPMPLEPA